MSNKIHGVFKGIVNGIHTRGEGGVLYVAGELCQYRFPSEFSNPDLREALETLVENEHNFYVVEAKGDKLHVLAYPKHHVWDECFRQTPPTETSPIVDITPNDTIDDRPATERGGDDDSAHFSEGS